MATLYTGHKEVIRAHRQTDNRHVPAVIAKTTANHPPTATEALLKLCAEAGAVASTTIASTDEVVVFYKDGTGQVDSFDELHIRPQKDACILIAVFNG